MISTVFLLAVVAATQAYLLPGCLDSPLVCPQAILPQLPICLSPGPVCPPKSCNPNPNPNPTPNNPLNDQLLTLLLAGGNPNAGLLQLSLLSGLPLGNILSLNLLSDLLSLNIGGQPPATNGTLPLPGGTGTGNGLVNANIPGVLGLSLLGNAGTGNNGTLNPLFLNALLQRILNNNQQCPTPCPSPCPSPCGNPSFNPCPNPCGSALGCGLPFIGAGGLGGLPGIL